MVDLPEPHLKALAAQAWQCSVSSFAWRDLGVGAQPSLCYLIGWPDTTSCQCKYSILHDHGTVGAKCLFFATGTGSLMSST